MRRLLLPLKLLALTMVLVLLTVRLGSYADETFATPIEDVLFNVAFIAASEVSKQSKPPLFAPKRAVDFADCDTAALLPVHVPVASLLTPLSPYRAWPEIYLDIFVPPDERA